ncbi:MFS transporter [Pseudofrankia sp. DC12]|uniref:MFS transporter n=1 Tax=Pseudofrankia sp. DC12 TaxID=683315 RepID=UPI0005F76DB4|nr:MFS transporter [Pseudofrankia sp. DC12]
MTPTTSPADGPGGPRGRLSRLAVDTRPLAIPAFRRTFLGQGTAIIGTMVTEVTAPVQIYDISGSSFAVGLAGLVGLVPMVVFGLYGGAVADAVDRRTLYLASSLLTWAVTLVLLAQSLLGARSVGLILGLVAVQAAGFAVSSSTRGAVVPALVPVGLVPAANSLNYTATTVGAVIGPLVAGLLLGFDHGFSYAYGADAVLFTAALYSTFRLPSLRPEGAAGRPGLRSVLDGLRFIGGNPVLLMSFVVDIAAMVLAMPRALFPEAAATRFHGGVGLLYSAIALGSVLAGLSSGWIGRVRRQGVVLTVAVVGWATAISLAGFAHVYWLAIVLLALAGAADLISAVCRQTILQTYVPDNMRGRLQGVFTVVVAGGPRLGDLRAGVMAAATTLTIAWSGSAILCVVLVLAAAVAVRPFWRYDTAAATADDAPAQGAVPPPARPAGAPDRIGTGLGA